MRKPTEAPAQSRAAVDMTGFALGKVLGLSNARAVQKSRPFPIKEVEPRGEGAVGRTVIRRNVVWVYVPPMIYFLGGQM